jgi:DNA-binding NarL/FixJ family response regulator
MPTSDSSLQIGVLLIGALVLVFFLWMRLYRRRGRTYSNDYSVKIINLSPNREISERQTLWNTLSNREEQITRLAAEDWSDDEIARELHLSVRTVQNHLQHAREKLHIHSRHELKYFVRHLGD